MKCVAIREFLDLQVELSSEIEISDFGRELTLRFQDSQYETRL
jgi:hypothetical protein